MRYFTLIAFLLACLLSVAAEPLRLVKRAPSQITARSVTPEAKRAVRARQITREKVVERASKTGPHRRQTSAGISIPFTLSVTGGISLGIDGFGYTSSFSIDAFGVLTSGGAIAYVALSVNTIAKVTYGGGAGSDQLICGTNGFYSGTQDMTCAVNSAQVTWCQSTAVGLLADPGLYATLASDCPIGYLRVYLLASF